MQTHSHNHQKGISLLEAITSICLILILIAIVSERILSMLAITEHVALNQMLINLKSTLEFETLTILATDKQKMLAEKKDCINPMEFFSIKPYNYVGSFAQADIETIPDQSWFFDQEHCQLVYKVKYVKAFPELDTDPPLIHFFVKVLYSVDTQTNKKRFVNLILKTLDPY